MIERPPAAGLVNDQISEQAVAQFVEDANRMERTVGSVLLGQDQVIRETLIALMCGGHVLLEGVPGLGKTLLVRTLGACMDASFSRIQFTPDLMPADITGTTILREDEHGGRYFAFQPGPLFAHLVLADEVNRATPKTQSALLESMQERTVTIGRDTHELPSPFFVLATQNPLEMEGTYPLPEAQLDRFLFKILVPFPSAEVLHDIARRSAHPSLGEGHVLTGERLLDMEKLAMQVPIAAPLIAYAVSIVRGSHPAFTQLDRVKRYVRAGVSPRGLQALVSGAKVRALLEGRYNVSLDDLRVLARPSLRHRILLNFEGQAEGLDGDRIIDDLLESIPQP